MFNWTKTFMLMAAITMLFVVIDGMIGGRDGMMLTLLFVLGMNFFSYWSSDKMVLHMYNAQEINETSVPQFRRMVQGPAGRADLPMSRAYLIGETQPNAFATGRSPEHAAVAATTGILGALSERRLRGVMTHELAHAQHHDILIPTILTTIVGVISALTNFTVFSGGRNSEGRPANPIAGIVMATLAPLTASLIQMTTSHAREFETDRGGATINGDLQALVSVLDKIHRYAAGIPSATAEAHPATAQMMIMSPLHSGGLVNLPSTHPATEERIVYLMQMAQTG